MNKTNALNKKGNKKEPREKNLHLDSWQNVLTGLGTNLDKRTSATVSWEKLTEADVEEIYAGDDQARKANDLLPKDMVRTGFKLVSTNLDEKQIKTFMESMDALKWQHKFSWAMSWARLYGGSAIILGIKDGVAREGLLEPLNEANIQSIDFLNVVNRYELQARLITTDPQDPNFGLPETYWLQPHAVGNSEPNTTVEIHHSRIIRFDGFMLPRRQFIDNNYWGDSLMGLIRNSLMNYNAAYDSVGVLMNDFSQSIFKIKDLADIVSAEDGEELIKKRVEMVEMARSLVRATIIDAEDEDWRRDTVQMEGISEILVRLERRLVQSTGYPHTVFLGEEPGGGFGHTGKSEQRDYYDYVSREQEEHLRDQIEKLVRYQFLAKNGPTSGIEPESWSLEFNPLWQVDDSEIADRRLKQSQTDVNYINSGVLDPSEVAESRFSTGEFNFETTLDDSVDRTPRDPEEFTEPVEQQSSHRVDLHDEGFVDMPTDVDGQHKHQFKFKEGFEGFGRTGKAVDMGNGFHFHNTKFGPTTVDRDGAGHIHMIQRAPEGIEKTVAALEEF